MTCVLGIDQGSTHTRAAVAALDGTLLSVAVTPGACHAVHGMERAMQTIRAAADQALAAADVRPADLAVLYGGLTGADWDYEYPLLEKNLLALGLCDHVAVKNDSIIALRGGTHQPYGAVLICGTGGNCGVRAPDGREYVYGYFHDQDLQGGGALTTRVLWAVFRSATGREAETQLVGWLLKLAGLPTIEALCQAYFDNRLTCFAAVPPLLFETAWEGDAVSRKVIAEFAEGCAGLLIAALKRFEMGRLEFDIVFSGSVFKGRGHLLAAAIEERVRLHAPWAHYVNARYEPVVGAVLLGLEHLGITIDERIAANIESSARRRQLLRLHSE